MNGNKGAHAMAQLAQSEPNKVWLEEMHLAINDVYFQDLLN